MKIEVHFNHLERSESLEQLATEKVAPILETMMRRETAHALIWLVCDHSRHHQRGEPEYRCEIEVRSPPRRDVFVSKSCATLPAAINEAAHALKVLAREQSKREISTLRHRHGALADAGSDTDAAATAEREEPAQG